MYSSYYCIVALDYDYSVNGYPHMLETCFQWRYSLSRSRSERLGCSVSLYVFHCCLLSLHVHTLVRHQWRHVHTLHLSLPPQNKKLKWGLLSWLKHVRYTVLWYQLEGGQKSCQYFDYPVFFRANEDRRSIVEMSGGFSSTFKLVPENCVSHKTGANSDVGERSVKGLAVHTTVRANCATS